MIEAKNLSIQFGKRQILSRVDVSLQKNEMVGLIGPNGAGKSTLMKAMMGFIFPSEGEILWEGKRIEDHRSLELAKKIAYLPQTPIVHWPLPVERVVALGRIPHLTPWQSLNETDEACIERAMKSTDTWHLRDRPMNELAGGEKSLVLLARALAVEPAMVLADEPVAGLDPSHQIQVMELLAKQAKEGHGMMVVLHDLSLAARFCHRLLLVHQGKLIAAGSPQEVLSEENLKQTYGIQVKYGRTEEGFYIIPWKRL